MSKHAEPNRLAGTSSLSNMPGLGKRDAPVSVGVLVGFIFVGGMIDEFGAAVRSYQRAGAFLFGRRTYEIFAG